MKAEGGWIGRGCVGTRLVVGSTTEWFAAKGIAGAVAVVAESHNLEADSHWQDQPGAGFGTPVVLLEGIEGHRMKESIGCYSERCSVPYNPLEKCLPVLFLFHDVVRCFLYLLGVHSYWMMGIPVGEEAGLAEQRLEGVEEVQGSSSPDST